MQVVYSCYEEVIVCTPEQEQEMLKVYFTNGGRDLEDYDRKVTQEPVQILSRMLVA
jgi:hypothetical protein